MWMLTVDRLFSHRARLVRHLAVGPPQGQVWIVAVRVFHVADADSNLLRHLGWITSSFFECSWLRWRGECPHCSLFRYTETIQTGMPIGLSLVSGRYRDQKLVAVAKEVAKVFKGAHGDQIRQLAGVPSGLL